MSSILVSLVHLSMDYIHVYSIFAALHPPDKWYRSLLPCTLFLIVSVTNFNPLLFTQLCVTTDIFNSNSDF